MTSMAAAFLWFLLPVAAQGQRGQQVQLPDGSGKELVQTTCSKCHALNMITNSWGNTREGWQTLFGSMVELPKDQATLISEYLATHFPVKPAPEAVVKRTIDSAGCTLPPILTRSGAWRSKLPLNSNRAPASAAVHRDRTRSTQRKNPFGLRLPCAALSSVARIGNIDRVGKYLPTGR